MSKTELRPCPCCGGPREIRFHEAMIAELPSFYTVWCEACQLEWFRGGDTKSEAIADANRRAADPAVVARIVDWVTSPNEDRSRLREFLVMVLEGRADD